MIVSRLVLRNFRNYSYVDVDFEKGLNIIVGENAEGKTNIVEAIHFLSLARSFRTSETLDLIKKTCQFATIEAWVEEDTTRKNIVAIMTPSGKKITCNNNQVKKISELSNLINVLVYEPKDTRMFMDSPLVRRNYLDVNLSKTSLIYLDQLMRFEKILKERNGILKGESIDELQLKVITEQLIDVEEQIVRMRSEYIDRVNQILSKVIASLSGVNDKAEVIYEPFVKCDDNFITNATKLYEKSLESDIKHKVTQNGIHREDMKMLLNGKDISSYGSTGENKIAVIALKLCPYFLIGERSKRPIIVLDDVMSELDKEHRSRLIKFLSKFEQVFITTTATNVKNASIYEVKKHKITRRNA